MDGMAAAMGAFTCIRSDPVEPVDPEKPLLGVANGKCETSVFLCEPETF